MREITKFGNGKDGYDSVALTRHNNRDVLKFWKDMVELDESQGRVPSQYTAWLRTWGQYARLCIASGFVDERELVQEGNLFVCLTNRKLLGIFVDYYRLRGRPGTVASKAIQLNKLSDSAANYYLGKGRHQEVGLIKENIKVSQFFPRIGS